MPVYEMGTEPTHELESEFEAELEGEFEGEFELEGEGEFESEFELEGDGELENPVRRVYADAIMEHLGHAAAESESEQEAAEQFLPLVGLAAKKLLPVVARAVTPSVKRALPKMAKAITRVEPKLTQGITRIAKVLHRNPNTRALLKAVPAVARRTVYSVARQAAGGRPVTAKSAMKTLATQAKRVLVHPRQRRRAMQRSTILDNHLHRKMAAGAVRPHWRHYRGWQYPNQPGYAGPASSRAGRPVAAGSSAYGAAPGVGGCACGAQSQYCRCCGQLIR